MWTQSNFCFLQRTPSTVAPPLNHLRYARVIETCRVDKDEAVFPHAHFNLS